jgi:hypothetical protein
MAPTAACFSPHVAWIAQFAVFAILPAGRAFAGRRGGAAAAVIAVSGCWWWISPPLGGFNPAADPAILAYSPPSVSFIKQADPGLWRYTTYNVPVPVGETPPKPFNANAGWYFDLYDIRGYDSIFTQQYKRYMELIQNQYELDYNRIAPLSEAQALHSPLLDLLNVRYVFTQDTIDDLQTLITTKRITNWRPWRNILPLADHRPTWRGHPNR